MKGKDRIYHVLGGVLTLSMGTTVAILMMEGRGLEAIPLHLCSVSALLSLALVFLKSRSALDFLWYLGMPGALLALLFPAPAVCRLQPLMNLSYAATHLLILIIPALRMASGMRPRGRRAALMMLCMQGIALAAYGVNRMLGTDFLFLMAPPAGTPLEALFRLGYPAYLIALETLILLTALAMENALALLAASDQKQN